MASLTSWSDKRLAEWTKVETWYSAMGMVEKVLGEEWVGRVNLPNGKVGRIGETFVSAEVAMASVERVWKRENK